MATPIPRPSSYSYGSGVVRVYWSTDIDDINDVDRADLNGATDLTPGLAALIGWEVLSDNEVDPNWGVFDAQRPGRVRVPDSSLVFRADRAGQDVRTTFVRGVTGTVIIFPSGDVQDHTMNVYSVQVRSAPHPVRADGPSQLAVDYSITARPAENVTVPAL